MPSSFATSMRLAWWICGLRRLPGGRSVADVLWTYLQWIQSYCNVSLMAAYRRFQGLSSSTPNLTISSHFCILYMLPSCWCRFRLVPHVVVNTLWSSCNGSRIAWFPQNRFIHHKHVLTDTLPRHRLSKRSYYNIYWNNNYKLMVLQYLF